MLITANQPFGAWNTIFPDPAMTLAAVDRLVHHYIWHTLFTWDVAAKDDKQEVTVIVDMKGFKLAAVTPALLGTLVRVAPLLRAHFPERESGIYCRVVRSLRGTLFCTPT